MDCLDDENRLGYFLNHKSRFKPDDNNQGENYE